MQIQDRPRRVEGVTYKIKRPGNDHALYVTINHVVGPDGRSSAAELFLNSKDVAGHPWIVALSRMVSAIFRRGGDVTFVAEELEAVFDPAGGFRQGRKYYPSVISQIGEVIRERLAELNPPPPPEIKMEVQDCRQCPHCGKATLTKEGGCDGCSSCGYTRCD